MPLLNLCGQVVVGCCCCGSAEAGEGRSTDDDDRMQISPRFSFWKQKAGTISVVAAAAGKTSVGPEFVPSPSRLPSTKLQAGRPLRTFPSTVARLGTADEMAVSAERRDLAFRAGVKVIPHPDKVKKGGEDAYFISTKNAGVLGVADGVSGWASENVDPALFSKELMAHALAAVEAGEIRDDPRRLMERAHSSTYSAGAATAVIAILDKKGILRVANLGDCGVRIIREGRLVYATIPQQHYFDCPYQLSSEHAQTAADATVYELGVSEGDTVVLGSDGLYDNVFDYDIEATVQVFDASDENFASQIAVALATLASKHSLDRTYDSPYGKEAAKQGHDLPWWRKLARQKIGGKIDDITVVVGHIIGVPAGLEPCEEEKQAGVDSAAVEDDSGGNARNASPSAIEQGSFVQSPEAGEPIAEDSNVSEKELGIVEGVVDPGNAPVPPTGQEKVDSPIGEARESGEASPTSLVKDANVGASSG